MRAVGALAARLLLSGLGVGAYYLVLSLGALDAVLLARRPVGGPLVRLLGWLLSLAGLTTLAAMATPQLSPGPVIGGGGYLAQPAADGWKQTSPAWGPTSSRSA